MRRNIFDDNRARPDNRAVSYTDCLPDGRACADMCAGANLYAAGQLRARRNMRVRADAKLAITGPVAAKLYVSSDTRDADLFLVLRVFDPAGQEVVFVGSNDPRTPVGLGWLRASQRKLDPSRSEPWRPWHSHDEEWPLTPGEPVELDVEIWPTSIVVPPGFRVALTVRGKDYEYDGSDAALPHAVGPSVLQAI